MRVFPSKLSREQRLVYRSATLFFIAAFLAMLWPVYPFFSRIRPLILGMPLSLAYLVGWLLACFFVILAVYRWESRRGDLGDE